MPVVPFQRMRPHINNTDVDDNPNYMFDTRHQDRPPESIEKPSEMAVMLAAAQMDQLGRFDEIRQRSITPSDLDDLRKNLEVTPRPSKPESTPERENRYDGSFGTKRML